MTHCKAIKAKFVVDFQGAGVFGFKSGESQIYLRLLDTNGFGVLWQFKIPNDFTSFGPKARLKVIVSRW